MIEKKFREIAAMCNGTLINAVKNRKVKGVSINTRSIQKGNLFIPIIGEKFDGHTFVEESFHKGAMLSLWNRNRDYSHIRFPLVLVDDTLVALQELAGNYRNELKLMLIGITGSNGKTSTKDILSEILSLRFRVQKTIGNFNNEIGVPLTLLGLHKRTKIAIVEMGMSELGEISKLSLICKPDIAIITSIGKAHLANLGSEEAIIQAKLEIVDGLKANGLLLINGDNQKLKDVVHKMRISQDLITFGQLASNYFTYCDVIQNRNSIEFKIPKLSDKVISVPVLGIQQASNATAAFVLARYLEMSIKDILKGLARVRITQARNEVIQLQHCMIINDSYKSNPESLRVSLETLTKLPGRFVKIAVLGDMRDLGVDEISYHSEIGHEIDASQIKYLYTFGDISKHIIDPNNFDVNHAKHFEDMESLEKELKPFLHIDSVMLVKGAHCLNMNKIIEDLRKES